MRLYFGNMSQKYRESKYFFYVCRRLRSSITPSVLVAPVSQNVRSCPWWSPKGSFGSSYSLPGKWFIWGCFPTEGSIHHLPHIEHLGWVWFFYYHKSHFWMLLITFFFMCIQGWWLTPLSEITRIRSQGTLVVVVRLWASHASPLRFSFTGRVMHPPCAVIGWIVRGGVCEWASKLAE